MMLDRFRNHQNGSRDAGPETQWSMQPRRRVSEPQDSVPGRQAALEPSVDLLVPRGSEGCPPQISGQPLELTEPQTSRRSRRDEPAPVWSEAQEACLMGHIDSLRQVDTPLQPWAKHAVAMTLGAQVVVLTADSSGSYSLSTLGKPRIRSVCLMDRGNGWGVWLPACSAPIPGLGQRQPFTKGALVETPLKGAEGFLFAAACAADYAGTARQFAAATQHTPALPVEEQRSNLRTWAASVTASLRLDTQAWLTCHRTHALRGLWEHFEGLLQQGSAEPAASGDASQPGADGDGAQAAAYCALTEAARFAPIFGESHTQRVAAQRELLETRLW